MGTRGDEEPGRTLKVVENEYGVTQTWGESLRRKSILLVRNGFGEKGKQTVIIEME